MVRCIFSSLPRAPWPASLRTKPLPRAKFFVLLQLSPIVLIAENALLWITCWVPAVPTCANRCLGRIPTEIAIPSVSPCVSTRTPAIPATFPPIQSDFQTGDAPCSACRHPPPGQLPHVRLRVRTDGTLHATIFIRQRHHDCFVSPKISGPCPVAILRLL